MNVTNNSHLSVPIYKGLYLTVAPGHEKTLELAMPHLSSIVDALNRHQRSPLLSEFMDTVLARFLRENNYTPKHVYMLRARMMKLKLILTSSNLLRRVAELGTADVQALKDELPMLLKQNSKSGNQGENLHAYYSLFNRMIDEAVGDNLIGKPVKIQSCKNKRTAVTNAFLDANLISLFSAWPYRQYAANIDRNTVLQNATSYSFWLMPLGLFTGARLNELCQLRAHDVIQDIHGVNLIDINANGFNKSLKNEQSARQIPICNKLNQMGFLDFVEERRQPAIVPRQPLPADISGCTRAGLQPRHAGRL
jgi:hypothetical protein